MHAPRIAASSAPLTLALLGFALSAGAQQAEPEPSPTPEEKEPPRYEEFVEVEGEVPVPTAASSAARHPVALTELPASVSVVPRSLFESRNAEFLTDALESASGVHVGTGFGVFDFFVIRGFDSLTSGLVLTDSVFEPESTFYPLYNVRRVEVLKGPSAFLYGGNPLSGAVHLVRKQPQLESFGDLSLSFGSFETAEGRADVNLARADGRLAFRLNGAFRDSDGYRDGKESRLAGVNPSLTWLPDDRTRLTLNLEYVRAEFAPDTGLPVAGEAVAEVPRTRSYQSPFDVSEQDIYRLRLDFERRLSSRLTLRNKLYYTDLEWVSDGTLVAGVVPNRTGGLDVARSMTLLDDRQRLLGNQAELTLSFETGEASHELLAGVELTRLADDFTLDVALLPSLDLFQPVETARRPLFLVPSFGAVGDTRSLVVAPYLVDRVRLSERWQVFIGGRFDVLDYEDAATATERDTRRLSPLAGVVFSPTPSLSLYASGGTAFAPPSSLVVGERKPERGRQLEAGLKKTFLGGKGLATLAAYHLERDEIAIPDAQGVLREAGDQRSRGVELELAAELLPGWTAFAAYAFNDAELTRFAELAVVGFDPATFSPVFGTVDRSGNEPAFAPRHLLSLWTMKEFAGGFGLGAGLRYVSSHFIAEDNAFAIEDYVVVDAMASYRRGRWGLRVNLENLTDTEYSTRGFGSASVIPAHPFAVSGQLELRLGSR